MLSSTLSGELRTDAVTASVLPVDPVDAAERDVDGVGVERSEGVSDEVERVERLFTGVVSDVICWFSEDKLAGVGPAKKSRNIGQCKAKHLTLMQIVKASMY